MNEAAATQPQCEEPQAYPRWLIVLWCMVFAWPIVAVVVQCALGYFGDRSADVPDLFSPAMMYGLLFALLLPLFSRHSWSRRLLDCITSAGGFCVLLAVVAGLSVLFYGLPGQH
jgi:hypothetical protein